MLTLIRKKPEGPTKHGACGPPVSKRSMICAKHIMSSPVAAMAPDTPVREVARLLRDQRISGAPVISDGVIVGIISEGDLLRRAELACNESASVPSAQSGARKAKAQAKAQGRSAAEVMTRRVLCATEETPLSEIARAMQENGVKRIPIVRGKRPVGIVSRADIIAALAERPADAHRPTSCDDDIIRYRVIETLMNIKGASVWLTEVSVSNGVVDLSGTVEDEEAKAPSRLAVEQVPCVSAVRDRRNILQPY
jgi:CBS domain-containing protein